MDQTKPVFKRVKERSVFEAKQSVDLWRKLFTEGLMDASGIKVKFTLQQAAEKVGIPKKTLEDYHQLLRKVEKITPLENLKDKKMGYLRQFLKENKAKFNVEEQEEEIQQQMQHLNYENNNPPAPFYFQQQEEIPEAFQEEQIAQPNNDNWEQMIIEGEIQNQQDSQIYQPRQSWHYWSGEEIKDQSVNQTRMQYYQGNQFNYQTPYVSFVLLPQLTIAPFDTKNNLIPEIKLKLNQLHKNISLKEEEETNEDRETSPDDDNEYQNEGNEED